ncbi:MAG TPA: CapA family protein [Anaerolineales bacterium]
MNCSRLYFLLALSLAVACQAQPSARTPSPSPTSPLFPTPLLSIPSPTGDPAASLAPLPAPTAAPAPTVAPAPTAAPTAEPVTTLLFTGVIAPARCVQAALDANGNPNYPYEEVREIIQGADLAVGTFNATLSDASPHTGCISTYVLVSSPNNADALAWAGFDLMSVATNHIKNCNLNSCGNTAFFDTLDNLHRVGIQTVGAGANLAEAMEPVVVTLHGIRFGFVSLGQIEPMSFAGPDSPGIAVLNDANLKEAIASARQVSDVVIVMPHWGPEDAAMPNWIQRNLARDLVAAGADLVMGNHTHVVQAVQQIDGVQVFYGLGNFVFDQGLRDHRQGVILKVEFQGTRYRGYEFIPTHVDPDGRVHIAGPAEAKEILDRVAEVSEALK